MGVGFKMCEWSGVERGVSYLLEEMRPRDLVEFALVDDFDGHLLPGEHVPCQLNNGEVSPAESLLQVIETGNLAAVVAEMSPGGQRG